MDDLIAFLRARWAEEAARAQAAPPGPWTVDVSGSIVAANGAKVVYSVGGALGGHVSRWPEQPAADFITSNGPDQALAQLAARQRLLDLYAAVAANDINEVEYAHGYANALGQAVRLLALPYVGHPDYRQEWRP